VLNERLSKEGATFLDVVLFENVEAGNADLIHKVGQLWEVSLVPSRLVSHCGKEHEDHHDVASRRHKVLGKRDRNHEVPDLLTEAVSGPVDEAFEQVKRVHELAKEVTELSQERLVQGIFLDLLQVDAVNIFSKFQLVYWRIKFSRCSFDPILHLQLLLDLNPHGISQSATPIMLRKPLCVVDHLEDCARLFSLICLALQVFTRRRDDVQF